MVVESRADFEQWLASQLAPASSAGAGGSGAGSLARGLTGALAASPAAGIAPAFTAQ